MSADMISKIAKNLENVRTCTPLVHNITNYVVMNSTANSILALGGSPAMVHSEEEVSEFVSISAALVVNIGTLSPHWVSAMNLAVDTACEKSIPWVLDPVGAGATEYRTRVATGLLGKKPEILRANAGECAALSSEHPENGPEQRGVDSEGELEIESVAAIARTSGCVVAMTGEVDTVSDGHQHFRIRGGDSMMKRVTGTGCAASALCGTFLGAQDRDQRNGVDAAVSALACLKAAGGLAMETVRAPGSLQVALIDALFHLNESALRKHVAIETTNSLI